MGAEESFWTIETPGAAEFTVRGSRFLGHVAPARSIAIAEEFIEEIRTAHPDATHVVPAYRVRSDPFREWSSDDGEPRGSAGKPIMTVLRGHELENVVTAVVRYYGGTNLGIGGLVRAYGEAAKQSIAAAEVVKRRPITDVRVEVVYDHSGTIRSILESTGVSFDATYGEVVTFEVQVPVDDENGVRERILSATGGEATIESTHDSA